jgi:tetratricopeptide (TPR) repeat protein
VAFCQNQVAVTESGKKVILKSNGTWEYSTLEECTNFNVSIYNSAKSKIVKGQGYNHYFNKAWQYVNNSGEKSYEAVVNFEQAIKLFPTNGGVYSDLGNCYRGFKCYEKAKYYYSKAIENGFSEGFVYYNRAICNYELDKLDEMKSDLEMSRGHGWTNDYYKLSEK